jgi:hypothetical protein
MFEELDELARGLAENDISRRQAIRWAGYSVLGTALSSVGFAESAEALTRRARRRCRRKGGTPLEKGTCHCGYNCPGEFSLFECENDPQCACGETTEGSGVCARINIQCNGLQLCTASGQCPTGYRCIRDNCCGSSACFPLCSL